MLEQPSWRIELYRLKSDSSYPGYLSDISNFYTSELTVQKERNCPDEVHFTLDLVQLQNRATELGVDVNMMLEPYKSLIKVYRNNDYVTQVIVEKTTVNLKNDGNNDVEVSCVDWLGILDKRVIHQDYGGGSWADFANEVLMDAQHEPNRIYNYAFEGDGTGIDNVWFKGWKYHVPPSLSSSFSEWEAGVTYQMYDHVTYNGKFWECSETHVSEDSFSESYWEEIGTTTDDRETDFTPIYAVWREDDEEDGPSGTHYGGWGGTSSCHMTAETTTYNTPTSGSINLSGSAVSTSLVAPIAQGSDHDDVLLPSDYQPLDYLESTGTQYIDTNQFGTGIDLNDAGDFSIETEFQFTSVTSGAFNCLYGSENLNSLYGTCTLRIPTSTQTQFEIDYHGATTTTGSSLSVTGRHTVLSTWSEDDQQITSIFDDTTTFTSSAATTEVSFSTYPLVLFGCRRGDSTVDRLSNVKIWSFKLTNGSGTVLSNLIPAMYKPDGTVGMYDTVGKRFYTDESGTGFKYSHNTSPSLGSTYTRVMAKGIGVTPVNSSANTSLPSGYTAIAYVNTNGSSGIVIDDGNEAFYPLNQPTITSNVWEVDVSFNAWSASNSGVGSGGAYIISPNDIMAISSDRGACDVFHVGSSGISVTWGDAYYTGGSISYTNSMSTGTRYSIETSVSSSACNLYVNDSIVATGSYGSPMYTDNMSYSILCGYMNVYGVSVTNTSTQTALMNLVPCSRDSDGAIGFYDTVTNTFLTDSLYQAPPTVTFKTFIESYGGETRVYSSTFSLSSGGWSKCEYTFPEQDFDIYRFGIQILSGEALFDTPVVYKARENGDEWDLGLRPGDFPTSTEQEDAKWLHNRFSSTFEWKSAKETLQDLSNMDSDNFWFNIDKNKRFNIYINGGGRDVAVDLSYPKNITSMSITSNAADIVNYVKGDGSAEVTQDPLVSGVKNSNGAPFTWIGYDTDSMSNYWPLVATESFDSERTITNLKADIDAKITTYSNILDVPEISIENNAVDLSKINLGDIIAVSALNNPYVQKINGLYKIESIKIKASKDGSESLALTLLNTTANQLNALTFPQIIKAIMRRTNY